MIAGGRIRGRPNHYLASWVSRRPVRDPLAGPSYKDDEGTVLSKRRAFPGPVSSFDFKARCVQLPFEKASAAKGQDQSLRYGLIGVREQVVSLQFNDARRDL